MPAKIVEDLEKTKADLNSHEAKANFELLRKSTEEEKHKWDSEIEFLEKRPQIMYVNITLSGNGLMPDGTIAIKTHLSQREEKRLIELNNGIKKGEEDAAFDIVELATMNPLITKDYLKTNPDRFSITDMIDVITGYYENRGKLEQERKERINSIVTFRTDKTRAKSG
jgi:hypothetical protein